MKKKKKNKTSFMAYVVILALMLIGVKGLFWVYSDTKLILESRNWRSAEALVTDAYLRKSIGGSKYNTQFMYSPHVKYAFKYNDRAYKGTRLQIPARRHSSRKYAEKKLKKYPVGAAIEIYFDPDEPEKSVVIKPSFNFFFTVFLGFISVGLIAAAGGLIVFMMRHKNQA